MSERIWTSEQQQCLDAAGTVLVSAAAGSGKTAVLVERIIRLLCDEQQPVNVDELLVVTFTKAAAAEMKQRLSVALTRALQARPDDRRLRRQLMLLPSASISTVHSFCSDLIRAHFHRLPDVSPVFTMAEEAQTAPLRAEAMDELLEECYTGHDPAFQRLVELLGGPKDDRRLARRIERLYQFVQSDPDPNRWLSEHAALYHGTGPIEQSVWGQELLHMAADALHWCAQLYRRAEELAATDPVNTAGGRVLLQAEAQTVQHLLTLCEAGDWNALHRGLCAVTFATFSGFKKACDKSLRDRLKQLRDAAKEKLLDVRSLLAIDTASAAADTAALAPVIDTLFDLVRRFSARYTEKKRQRAYLDFNDLEHLTLALLLEPDKNGVMQRTALAREVSQRFAHVMVDEYQDTNPTQEQIFRAVSQEERNLFFVGDVKQSIYAFRNATPELFIHRRDRYPVFDGTHYPATIRLGNNFRSRRSVTSLVNFCFEQLMTRETCHVDYAAGEALVCAASYPEKADDVSEVLLIDKGGRTATEADDVLEARGIARRIREMMDTMTIRDGDAERPLRYGDICLLMRSVKGCADTYIDELSRAGIPAVSSVGSGFFTASEILFTRSLLQFLDNPLQDIALLAVLLSPVFAFTPDEAAALRADRKAVALYVSLRQRAKQTDDPLGARCRQFLQQTDRLRTAAAVLSADRLLTRIYEELSLFAVMRAKPHGEQRVANLQQLLDMARRFEQNGYRGLSAFLRAMERQSEKDDMRPATVATDENAVHILTIHGSKGLEFPVVFLARLGSRFNNESAIDALPLHRELGAGMKSLDTNALEQRDTLQRQAIAGRIRRDERAEDLRVLYVAMTRARERLCLTMTVDAAKLATDAAVALPAAGIDSRALPAEAVLESGSFALWLMMALLRHPDAGELRRLAGAEDIAPLVCDSRLHIQCMAPPAPMEVAETAPDAVAPPDTAYLEALRQRLSWQYPHAALAQVPVKLAVSALAHRQQSDAFIATVRPAFFSETQLSPTERGTALHQFMQYADYTAAANDPAAEMRRLVRDGFLTAEQGAALPLSRLTAFFSGDLYARMARATRIWREYAFAVERPAAACVEGLSAEAAAEPILLQGIADCVFEEDGRLVIVDYKTDQVRTADELAARYQTQLALYAETLTVILDRPVASRLLYSFALQTVVPV